MLFCVWLLLCYIRFFRFDYVVARISTLSQRLFFQHWKRKMNNWREAFSLYKKKNIIKNQEECCIVDTNGWGCRTGEKRQGCKKRNRKTACEIGTDELKKVKHFTYLYKDAGTRKTRIKLQCLAVCNKQLLKINAKFQRRHHTCSRYYEEEQDIP